MVLPLQFPDQAIAHILDQSMLLQCACPAQVCQAIATQRKLYAYQENCLNRSDTDKAVHQRIAKSVEITHAELERCLAEILYLEDWDLQTYTMPQTLRDKMFCELQSELEKQN
jgi:hypothetical protein